MVFKRAIGRKIRSQKPAISHGLVGLRGPGPRLGTFCIEMETRISGDLYF